jgi:Na+/melibiose symporter-like transporter
VPALRLAAYGALGLPLAAAALPVYVYAPKFYFGLGLSLAVTGTVLLAARVADALIDPWLGLASDRTRHPRVFIAFALLPLTAGMVAMFNPPAGVPLAAWLIAMVTIVTLGFSAASIAFQSWGARLGGPRERAAVTATREGFGLAGVVLASMLPQAFAATVEAGLPAAVWVFAALTALCAAATFGFAPVVPDAPSGTRPHGGPLQALKSRGYRGLLGVFAINGIASAIPATLFLFFVADILGAAAHSGTFLALYFICAALALPLWVRLAARFGKRRAWTTAMALAIAAFAWAFFLGRGDTPAFAAICAASGAALGADLALPPAMLADIIEKDRAQGAEGSYFGLWNTVTKLNLAIAAGLVLPALEWSGYRSGAPETAALVPALYCVLPCALKLLAIAGMSRLPE